MRSKRWRQWLAGVLMGSTLALAGGAALALQVGDKAPDFALPASTGKQINLGDFSGKQHIVLFFYIGAFTNS